MNARELAERIKALKQDLGASGAGVVLSSGRPATKIEVEAMTAIANLQDENRELKLKVQRLKAEVDAYDRYIRGYLTQGQLEEVLKEAKNPSPVSHSQSNEVAK